MNSLIVGGDSFLGSNLQRVLGCKATSRRHGAKHYFNLGRCHPNALPDADVIYLVAGIRTFKECELDPNAYAVNVDAQIQIGALRPLAHIVYVSSEAAEWPNQTAYGAMKRAAEQGLLSVCGYKRLSVVRPAGPFTDETVQDLTALLYHIGYERIPGVTRWKSAQRVRPFVVNEPIQVAA